MSIGQREVDFYNLNGYLICEDLVSPDDIERLKQDALDVARGTYPCEQLKPMPDDTPDAEVLASVLCIHQPHYVSPVMLDFVKHPGMADVMSKIVAPDVKCMQSMLFVKPPGFQGQAWHQDEIYIPTRDRSLCGGWIAIDDATVDNGCLWVLPGSHKKGYLWPQRDHNRPEDFDSAQESYGFDDKDEVPVEVKAGTVVFFNGYLLHRSRPNKSDQYRRVLVNHYMNAYSLLPWQNTEAGDGIARADSRCVVMVAGEDPYAWKGYEQPKNEVGLRVCKANKEALTQ